MILQVDSIVAGYGRAPVLHGVSFELGASETLAILGPNGAGKSTLLKSIVGLLPLRQGRLSLDGEDISNRSPVQRAGSGVAWVPEGRRLFPSLTVQENLLIAGRGISSDEEMRRLDQVFGLFPDLPALLARPAWALSGGQQQMVAVGRALVARPRVLLLDEPSLGLAPLVVTTLMEALAAVGDSGQAMVLVEQNVSAGLHLADRAMILSRGRVTFTGAPEVLLSDDRIRESYLTGAA
ncbi:MAG: ABC transporter ATP-binding protein [Solirubrobacterales bacterium]